MSSQITLKEHQVDHYNKILNITSKYPCYIDSSSTGAGKTFVTMAIAKQLNLSVIVICPLTMVEVWKGMCITYGVRSEGFYSYQSLRSIRGKQPKHGLLDRQDDNVMSSFTASGEANLLISRGILVILDEAQHLKNDSDQFRAATALCKAIKQSKSKSLFAILSGSLFDKEYHTLQLLRLVGFIDEITNIEEPMIYEIKPFVNTCSNINAKATEEAINMYPLIGENIQKLVFELFTNVIKSEIVSSMKPPVLQGSRFMRNAYYDMSEEGSVSLSKGIKLLLAATSSSSDANIGELAMGAMVKAMKAIETAKTEIFVRIAGNILRANPLAKVIISVNYIDTITNVFNDLGDFRPSILIGQTPQKDRQRIVNNFQTNDECRLLLMNLALSEGISLHDTVGNRPRYMLLSPNFNIQDVHQAAGRVIRCGMVSDAHVDIVYGKAGRRETSILGAITRKASILKKIHDTQVDGGVLFPSDYEEYVENNDDDD